jgi:hypothetical protein
MIRPYTVGGITLNISDEDLDRMANEKAAAAALITPQHGHLYKTSYGGLALMLDPQDRFMTAGLKYAAQNNGLLCIVLAGNVSAGWVYAKPTNYWKENLGRLDQVLKGKV